MATDSLIPARFLCLIAHFVALSTLFWSRTENVKSCLPLAYSKEEFEWKDKQLAVGLSIAFVLLAVELMGFFAGISMFSPTQALISTAAHASAAVSLFYFSTDGWDCDLFWWIFGFCSVFPAITELTVIVGVLGLKKSL